MNLKILTRSGKERFLDFSSKEEEVEKEVPASLDLLTEGQIDQRIIRAMKEMGFEKLSPIQEQAIPFLLEGRDIIGQAQTGTGKTAAFGVPLIQKIDPQLRKLQGIVLCPTRELAIQAAEELRKLAKFLHGVKVLPVYGGQDINRQIMGLKGVQIIVGTPGRVMDHMRRHTIKMDDVKMVVLDEADEMLNMGFREDMETILGQIENPHQTALFSATMPQPILEITDRFQKDAKMVKVAAKELTIPLVSQKYYRIKSQDKDAACVRLLEYYQPKLCLIFCNTKKKVDEVADVLKKKGFQAEGLHGDLSQHQRDVAMGRFRNGSANILIATDVAARGIDVDDVEAVINYDVPQDIEYYVHRIGRTGRAGRTGRSFTFVSGREIFKIREIEKICRTTVAEKKLPGADKAFKAKADKYLNHAWELHKGEDMELMKSFLQRKMDEEGCDALDLACVMLRMEIGEKEEEIASDDYKTRQERVGDGQGRRRLNGRMNGRGDDRSGDRSHGRSGRRSDGRGDSRSEGRGSNRSEARSFGRGEGRNRSEGRSSGRGEARNRSEGRSYGRSEGHGSNRSEGRSFGRGEGRTGSRSESRSHGEKRGENRRSGSRSTGNSIENRVPKKKTQKTVE